MPEAPLDIAPALGAGDAGEPPPVTASAEVELPTFEAAANTDEMTPVTAEPAETLAGMPETPFTPPVAAPTPAPAAPVEPIRIATAFVRPTGRAANDPRLAPRPIQAVEIVTEVLQPGANLPPLRPVVPTRGPAPRAKNDPRERQAAGSVF